VHTWFPQKEGFSKRDYIAIFARGDDQREKAEDSRCPDLTR